MSLRLFVMDQLKINDWSSIEAIENIFKSIEGSTVFSEVILLHAMLLIRFYSIKKHNDYC